MNTNDRKREYIEVSGIVQGVGFRPFIHNRAERLGLSGYVLNTPDGVVIEVEGRSYDIGRFVDGLVKDAPPLSRITGIRRREIVPLPEREDSPVGGGTFEIRESLHEGGQKTLISPDVCVCGDCLEELFDPADRRYLYPFINCTNCGPRFTIIRDLPYDRPYTTMAAFSMCPDCRAEYVNPRDRRFHAQPIACPVCGPRAELLDGYGKLVRGDPILNAISLLRSGKILAVKGLGGFHLAVDGTNGEAVERLRRRKHREEKPFALMTGTVEDARRLIRLESAEESLLAGRERPILLAPREKNAPAAADSVAPGNAYLGVMLPYTPIHYLLFFHPQAGGDYAHSRPVFPSLVMTSGNISEEPICRDNLEALDRLGGIADAFLMHNRDIHVRSDDSVVNIAGNGTAFIRRSRGFVPVPVFLPEKLPTVLALGAELKNTVCITEGSRAFLSQHIGDLENITTLDFFHEAVEHFNKILELSPRIFAYDLHPRYLSTQYFTRLVSGLDEDGYGAAGIQHHHAHIASVLAEYGRGDTVIGFALDGTGFGTDGTVWGGEILLASPVNALRLGHLDCVPLPGGESAVREPWRMAFSYLREAWGEDWHRLALPCLDQVSRENLEILDKACAAGVNCPRTSSLGRLFDAVASILGICHTTTYEGQAAIMLEMCAARSGKGRILPYSIEDQGDAVYARDYPTLHGTLKKAVPPQESGPIRGFVIDYRPLVRSLTEGVLHGRPVPELAMDFHETIVTSCTEAAGIARERSGISTVALSGGCFQNRILCERLPAALETEGFEVLVNRLVPPNDGGVSLGQAYIAGTIARRVCADWM